VNDALVQDVFKKLTNAVGTFAKLLPEVGLGEITSVLPPAVYPVPTTSLVVVYTVVVGPIFADAVYSATLKVSGDVGPKL
jgi:hypothetical protein